MFVVQILPPLSLLSTYLKIIIKWDGMSLALKRRLKKVELSKAVTLTFILLTINGVEIKTKRMSLTSKNFVVSFN